MKKIQVKECISVNVVVEKEISFTLSLCMHKDTSSNSVCLSCVAHDNTRLNKTCNYTRDLLWCSTPLS